MSQYLEIFLCKKESETSVQLIYFCTTPARQIADMGAFPYTTVKVLLDNQTVQSYLSTLIEERDSYKECLERIVLERNEIEQNLFKCSSKEVAEVLLERIESLKQSISDLTETIEEWNYIIDRVSFAIDVWENNSDEWDLYYINC